MHIKKTIYALSSAPGKSAIAVYRISGPSALDTITKLSGAKHIEPKKFYRSYLKHPTSLDEIDDVMFVFFAAPKSFTGEDLVEIYTHGSIAVQKILVSTLEEMPDLRYAEAGEFAKRSLLNGKTDLTKIEGLMDLINSETSMQHKQALNQMKGYLSDLCSKWRTKLIELMSLVEAYIDFPDEDIPDSVILDAEITLGEIMNSLDNFLQDKRKGERLRSGITMAIIGKTNAGKSSLMNYLTNRNVAIVSDIAGTTRDVLETHLDIGGYPIILIDTAGIRETDNIIEQEGIKRAIEAAQSADINILMRSIIDEPFCGIDNLKLADKIDNNIIYVANKSDLLERGRQGGYEKNIEEDSDSNITPELQISLKENLGLNYLIEEIILRAGMIAGNGSNKSIITQERHRACINDSLNALRRVDLRADLVLAAEDLRMSARHLLLMIGKIDSENILDQIFSSFCIGK
ncbi:MAG: tRNA uridine-5-carboxymethylaminomethyl(34) synthesis GTPase MnmE [Alphaproteobacteria bacterium]|nr:tRNA uridine-5-carboxymethylaminomethyl(34) synthesis GTPase MnmE [Alphaproteobacteria bacterium]